MDDKIKKAIEEGERMFQAIEEARLQAEEEKAQERRRKAEAYQQERRHAAQEWGKDLAQLIHQYTANGTRTITVDCVEKAHVARTLGLTVKEVYHPGWLASGTEKADGGYDQPAWTDWEISW